MKRIILVTTLVISASMFSQKYENSFFMHEKTVERLSISHFSDTNMLPNSNWHQLFMAKKDMPAIIIEQKTRKATKQCLDSIVSTDWKITYLYDNSGNNILGVLYYWNHTSKSWDESQKVERSYDNNGRLTSNIYYNWKNKDWKEFKKSVAAYDNNGNLMLETYYDWDDSKSDWIGYQKNEYAFDTSDYQVMSASYLGLDNKNNWIGYRKDTSAYDANRNQILSATYFWDDSKNDWYLFYMYKIEYVFDTNGRPIMGSEYRWIDNDWETDSSAKREYAYDTNGNQTMYVRYIWANNAWFGTTKYEKTYDSNGNQLFVITYDWRNNNWRNSQKGEYAYDSNSNLTLEIGYGWDTVKNDWLGYSKREFAYDNNSKMTLEIYYDWDAVKNDWLGYHKGVAAYDNYGNRTLMMSYDWENNDWQEGYKAEYMFNLSYSMDETFYPWELYSSYRWLFFNTNIITERKLYEWKANNWEQYFNEIFYYSTHNVSVTEPQAVERKIFPNPAQTHFTVTNTENANLYLYNVMGQEILRTYSTDKNTVINVNILPQGVYVLKVTKDGVLSTHKVLVR